MQSSPSLEFAVEPVLHSDIPRLIEIHMAGFASDNATRLMFKDSAAKEQRLREMLRSQISDPRYALMKAVSTGGSKTLGWLGCGWVGYAETQEKVAPAMAEEMEKHGAESETHLRKVMREDFAKVQNEWMAGKKYIHIGTLVSDPAHQGQGAATGLIHWATTKADRDRIPCWLQSSPVVHSLYYRAGFRDVGRLEVDLRDFVPGAKQSKCGWGPYEFRYMLRLQKDIGVA